MSDPTTPATTLDPRLTRRTMRLSLLEGGATQLFINWTTGSVLTGYLMHFGARPQELALVASVPLLAQVTSPFAAALAARLGSRKKLTALFGFVGRLLWILAAFLPQLGVPDAWRAQAIVLLVALSSLFQAANGSLWSAWMADVVPEKQRGRYFGMRAGILGVIGMLGNLAAGAFLDRVAAPLNFQVVLGVAVACALAGLAFLLLHDEPDMPKTSPDMRRILLAPWRNVNFRRLLWFSAYWHFAVLLASPFVFPYFLGQLKLTFTQVAVWTVIASTCALVTSWWWGRVADATGNKPVLRFGTILVGLALPGTWILAGLTGRLEFIWASAVLDALAWGAVGPALFNLALVSAPREERTAFYAMFSLAAGVAGCAGGLLAGPLLEFFLKHPVQVFGANWSGYHTLFAVSGMARATAWLLLRRVQETGEGRLRDGVRQARLLKPRDVQNAAD